MVDDATDKRNAIVEHCQALNSSGLNQGTSGNISIRHDDGMLVSPTSFRYDTMTTEDVVFVDRDGVSKGLHAPSSEWRFHLDILRERQDVNAVVHAHPTYCTTLAIHNKSIPAIHYMIAVFGGATVRCAPYEIYGSQALSEVAVAALKDRKACLLAHHGMIAIGGTIEQAFWLAGELEALARQYHGALLLGEPPLLSDAQIQKVITKISGYGLSDADPAALSDSNELKTLETLGGETNEL